MEGAGVSWVCQSRAPLTGQLKQQGAFFPSSGGQLSKVKVSAGMTPPEVHDGALVPGLLRLPVVRRPSSAGLGSQMQPSDLGLHCHIALSLCAHLCPNFSFL